MNSATEYKNIYIYGTCIDFQKWIVSLDLTAHSKTPNTGRSAWAPKIWSKVNPNCVTITANTRGRNKPKQALWQTKVWAVVSAVNATPKLLPLVWLFLRTKDLDPSIIQTRSADPRVKWASPSRSVGSSSMFWTGEISLWDKKRMAGSLSKFKMEDVLDPQCS